MTSDLTNRRGTAACFLLALVALAGCGRGDFRMAGVSGVVTLDGKPLPSATVQFQPQPSGESPLAGPTSFGLTDSEGRFELSTRSHGAGAVVGTHLVSLSTFDQRMVDPQNSDRTEVLAEERIPKRYRAPTELRFEVPNRGTDEANFDLQSK